MKTIDDNMAIGACWVQNTFMMMLRSHGIWVCNMIHLEQANNTTFSILATVHLLTHSYAVVGSITYDLLISLVKFLGAWASCKLITHLYSFFSSLSFTSAYNLLTTSLIILALRAPAPLSSSHAQNLICNNTHSSPHVYITYTICLFCCLLSWCRTKLYYMCSRKSIKSTPFLFFLRDDTNV
jgi:hypothetical protein